MLSGDCLAVRGLPALRRGLTQLLGASSGNERVNRHLFKFIRIVGVSPNTAQLAHALTNLARKVHHDFFILLTNNYLLFFSCCFAFILCTYVDIRCFPWYFGRNWLHIDSKCMKLYNQNHSRAQLYVPNVSPLSGHCSLCILFHLSVSYSFAGLTLWCPLDSNKLYYLLQLPPLLSMTLPAQLWCNLFVSNVSQSIVCPSIKSPDETVSYNSKFALRTRFWWKSVHMDQRLFRDLYTHT